MAKTFKPKICVTCGKEYIPNNTCQKHCSDECRKNHYLEGKRLRNKNREFTCEWCGAIFTSDSKRKYCCAKCGKAANNYKGKSKNKPRKTERKKPKLTLAQINELARAEGLNYGQYVAKYGL